jgi:hypothetical protein
MLFMHYVSPILRGDPLGNEDRNVHQQARNDLFEQKDFTKQEIVFGGQSAASVLPSQLKFCKQHCHEH